LVQKKTELKDSCFVGGEG